MGHFYPSAAELSLSVGATEEQCLSGKIQAKFSSAHTDSQRPAASSVLLTSSERAVLEYKVRLHINSRDICSFQYFPEIYKSDQVYKASYVPNPGHEFELQEEVVHVILDTSNVI